MEAAAVGLAGLSPGFKFDPSDEDLVLHFLLPRLRGQPLPFDGAIVDDDPRSASPWELLARHGRSDEGFFFAPGEAKYRTGNRQQRGCAGGGTWKGQKSIDEDRRLSSGEVIGWRKYVLNFHLDGDKSSTGWVMHEFTITTPAYPPLMLCRVRLSEQCQKRKRRQEDGDTEGRARGAPRRPLTVPPQSAHVQITADDDAVCGAMLVPVQSVWPSAPTLEASEVYIDADFAAFSECSTTTAPSYQDSTTMPAQSSAEETLEDWPGLLDFPGSFVVPDPYDMAECSNYSTMINGEIGNCDFPLATGEFL